MEEAFAGDRRKYGTSVGPVPAMPVPPLPAAAGRDPLPVAREIGRMKDQQAMLAGAVIRAQKELLSIERPEWNVTKAIEAAEWALRSRGPLRDLAEKIDKALQQAVPYAALRETLREVLDEINMLGP